MKQREYVEGPEALENFKRLARAILQAKKSKKKEPKGAIRKKPTKSDKDDSGPFFHLSHLDSIFWCEWGG
jgi:hypothetical protein